MKETIILFDLDGTLIDSTDAILSTFYYSFDLMNFKFDGSDEDIKKLIGYPLEIMYENLGVPKQKAFDFVDVYKERYRKISKEQTYLLDNAVLALEEAKKFARLSVVTTKTRAYSVPLLHNLGILDFFEFIIGRENVINPKPHCEPILKTLELMDIEIIKSNIWMVGDTKLDLIAANSANINSVAVLCGYGEEKELKKYTSNITLNALEAVKLIAKLSPSKTN